ncbi:MAG: hypothetical protein ACKO6N_21140 [Myxococcota bacterium]
MSQYTEKLTVQTTNKNEDIPRLMVAVSGNKSAYVVAFVYNLERDECLLIYRKRGTQQPKGWYLMGGESSVMKHLDGQEILSGDYENRLSRLEQVSPQLGEIHYKGSWSATLELEEQSDGVVEALLMMKRIIGHRMMVISGHFKSHEIQWESMVQRGAHWAAEPVTVKKTRTQPTLKALIEVTLQQLMTTTASWCSVKENTRRASLDADYAALHPINPGKAAKPKAVAAQFEKVKTDESVKKRASTAQPKTDRKVPSKQGKREPVKVHERTKPAPKKSSVQDILPQETKDVTATDTRKTIRKKQAKASGSETIQQQASTPMSPLPMTPKSNTSAKEAASTSDSQARIANAVDAIRGAFKDFVGQRKQGKTDANPNGDTSSALRNGHDQTRR